MFLHVLPQSSDECVSARVSVPSTIIPVGVLLHVIMRLPVQRQTWERLLYGAILPAYLLARVQCPYM
jgi:hypothetical protein